MTTDKSARERGRMLNDSMGPLVPANIDAQFCSDWLKDEIRRVFAELTTAWETSSQLRQELNGVRAVWMLDQEALGIERETSATLRAKNEKLVGALEHINFICTKGTSKIMPQATVTAVGITSRAALKEGEG